MWCACVGSISSIDAVWEVRQNCFSVHLNKQLLGKDACSNTRNWRIIIALCC